MSLVLITRPIDQAQDFAAQVEAMGFPTLCAPMLEIRTLQVQTPDWGRYSVVIFTSANAVRASDNLCVPKGIALFCVGQKTADAARDKGFNNIKSVDADTHALVQTINAYKHYAGQMLLHIRGRDVAYDLVTLVKEPDIVIETSIVYEAVYIEDMPPNVIEAIKDGHVQMVTFFSKRTAEGFLKHMSRCGMLDSLKDIKSLCISAAVLEYVRAYEWQKAYASEEPNAPSMCAMLRDVCA